MPSTKRCVAPHGGSRTWLGSCCAWLTIWLTVLPVGRATAQKPPQRPASQPVKVAEIVRRDVEIAQTFVGTVVPLRVSQVGSPVEGRVIDLCVEEGDRVAKGATLAKLRAETLKIELASAKAELQLLEAELERLQVAGPMEIAQAEDRKLAAEALKEYTESRRQRGKSLSTDRAISADELAELDSAAVAALNVYEERKTGWELAGATWPIDVKRAEAKVRVQKKKIRGLRDDIAEHTILAPFDGYVSEEHTEVGQWIAKGGLVVEVVEEATEIDSGLPVIDVELPVLETYVSHLRAQPTEEMPRTRTSAVEIEALPGEPFDGEVVAIVPKADPSARTFPVKVRLKNRKGPKGILPKPGMFARVTLPLGTIPDALLVPKDAVVLGKGTKTVWTIEPQADSEETRLLSATPVAVVTGEESEEWFQVHAVSPEQEALLQPPRRVIVEGNERVNPKLPVRVIPDEK